jgi:hypothetical protein
MKRHRAAKSGRKADGRAVNERLEALLKDFLIKVTEAAYQVALKTGFRGSFIAFLSDLQEALESVIRQDRRTSRRGRPSALHAVAFH